MNGGAILLVDDEPMILRLSQSILAPLGLPIHAVERGNDALDHVQEFTTSLVVLDLDLPDVSGLVVLERLIADHKGLAVIMLTAAADVPTAVRALRLGAFDYLTKPVNQDELLLSAQRALERQRLVREVAELRDEIRTSFLAEKMGSSAKITGLIARVNEVARSSMSVLLLGETGSGKELVAQAIHRASGRRERPFIAVDCGAIPENLLESELFGHEEGAFTGARKKQKGQFQLAEGGTLFLDEVGNLSAANQAKLLRVLEDRRLRPLGGGQPIDLDIRIVAATNDDLLARVKKNEFRQDLYYRLAEYTIRLPPLRERREDIAHLAQRFREEAAAELQKTVEGFDADALARLREYDWPGNARELRNVVRQATLGSTDGIIHRPPIDTLVTSGGVGAASSHERSAEASTTTASLPSRSLKAITDEAIEAAERATLEQTLRATRGSRAETARILKVDPKTLYRKLKRYGIT